MGARFWVFGDAFLKYCFEPRNLANYVFVSAPCQGHLRPLREKGGSGRHLEACGGILEASGGMWKHLGSIWEASGGIWEASGRHLGGIWDHLEFIWGTWAPKGPPKVIRGVEPLKSVTPLS